MCLVNRRPWGISVHHDILKSATNNDRHANDVVNAGRFMLVLLPRFLLSFFAKTAEWATMGH